MCPPGLSRAGNHNHSDLGDNGAFCTHGPPCLLSRMPRSPFAILDLCNIGFLCLLSCPFGESQCGRRSCLTQLPFALGLNLFRRSPVNPCLEDAFFGEQCLEDMCADINNERAPVCAGVPCELVRHWDPAQPLLVGGLAASEEGRGFLQLRLKRHR